MDFLTGIFTLSAYNVAKMFLLLLEFMYIAFSYVLLRQEKLMAQTIIIPTSDFLKLFAFIHLIASIIVFIFSLMIL